MENNRKQQQMSAGSLSLCSGYGGLDLAVEEVFDAVTVAHAEIEPAACVVLEARWPGVPNLGDVKTADWQQWQGVELLTAGYPCQPFSHAGQRKGTEDERHLWPYVAAAIRGVRPRLIVLENVAGHRTLGLDTVLGDLAALRYDAQWTSLRAADVGAPHGRERLFILATDTKRSGRPRRSPDQGRRAVKRDAARRTSEVIAADASSGPLAGSGSAGHGLRLAAQRGDRTATDTDVQGSQGREPAGRRDVSDWRAATHPDGAGRETLDGRSRTGNAGRLQPLDGGGTDWGQFTAAIRRWERTIARPAPAPTEAGPRGGQRLSPRFVEWMMGLPAGWVTDVPGISRNALLKMLGNGVVPQQAAAALRLLVNLEERAA